METRASRVRHALIVVWLLAMIAFVYLPSVAITLASRTLEPVLHLSRFRNGASTGGRRRSLRSRSTRS